MFAWFRRRRQSNEQTQSQELRHADNHISSIHPPSSAYRCRLLEPLTGTIGPGNNQLTALRFTLCIEAAKSGTFVVRISYQKQATCDRQLRETRGRLRAISVPYDIVVERDGERGVLAGTLRLTLDGQGRLTRVLIRHMKAPFPALQAPLQKWLSRFVGEEFSYQRVAELGFRSVSVSVHHGWQVV